MTGLTEYAWSNGSWLPYRYQKSTYLANDNGTTTYLVGYPASQEEYSCQKNDQNDCSDKQLESRHVSLYENSSLDTQNLICGALTEERTLLDVNS